MNPQRFKRHMRKQAETLRREGLIDADQFGDIAALYPTTAWDFSSLGRWFLFFGAVSAAIGIFILGAEIFEFTLEKLAIVLGVVIFGCFWLGRWAARRDLTWTGRSVELLGGLSIIGLTFTLGILYSSGSGNWPALLLIDLLVLLPLAYLLRNVLLLVLTVIVFFTWFGGVTGYISGWGAYFFGMNYPMRFLIAGILMAGMALIHRRAEVDRLKAYDGFFKVWLSGGLFFAEMSLWLMSLFGNFGDIYSYYRESVAELFFFNILWAGFNVALLILGAKYLVSMMRGYAITFLIIQAYTLFFWHIAGDLGFVLSTFIAGGATLGLVFHLESRRRERKRAAAE
ncbi:MAG: DUF2157 domain-containing protein [Pseudomonadota bacterium]